MDMKKVKSIVRKIPGAKIAYGAITDKLNMLYYGIKYAPNKWGGVNCPICGNTYSQFAPAGGEQEVLLKNKVIAGGVRKNAKCPACGSLERLRLEYLYLKQHTDIITAKCSVLHFAPERILTKMLRKNPNIDYHSGDIEKGRAMHVVDITDICFSDNFFDYVICNHVLEHIPDDSRAISEIKRVLKPNGKAIIMVPMSAVLERTIENQARTDEERLRLYGQEDHVRIYGLDFKQRMVDCGFNVTTFTAGIDLAAELVERYAMIGGETVFIAYPA